MKMLGQLKGWGQVKGFVQDKGRGQVDRVGSSEDVDCVGQVDGLVQEEGLDQVGELVGVVGSGEYATAIGKMVKGGRMGSVDRSVELEGTESSGGHWGQLEEWV